MLQRMQRMPSDRCESEIRLPVGVYQTDHYFPLYQAHRLRHEDILKDQRQL